MWKKLTDRHKLAALHFASGAKVFDICRIVGVDYKTLWRWRQQPLFQAKVEEIRGEVERKVKDAMADLAVEAMPVLEKLMHSANHSIALRAVKLVLSTTQQPAPSPSKARPTGEVDVESKKNLAGLLDAIAASEPPDSQFKATWARR